jgi:hypothetical protein
MDMTPQASITKLEFKFQKSNLFLSGTLFIESNDQLVFCCKWSEYDEEADAFYRNG